MMIWRKYGWVLAVAALTFTIVAQGKDKLNGRVQVDGSSTVFPITEAIAEEFGKKHPRVRVTVGVSGTGGGFKKFCTERIDINDASRQIKESEKKKCSSKRVQYQELPVAYDGISVVVNPNNKWVDYLTVAELKKIWEPGSKVKTWADIRKGWPNRKIRLYGPGTDSGTFDYFTEAIVGKSHSSRSDFTKSEDDNVLVKGVAGDLGSLGFFGYAYYKENQRKLKAVPIKQGKKKPVLPSLSTIGDGSYAPLSRPVFVYVNLGRAKRPEVKTFVNFYLENAASLVKDVGYIPLSKQKYDSLKENFARKVGFNQAKK